MEALTRRRGEIFDRYVSTLAPLVERGVIGIPAVPAHCTTNYHMFYILTADIEERTELIAHLRAAGILALFHYVPLHSSPFAQSLGGPQPHLPHTDDLSARLLRLPMYFSLSDWEVDEVADRVLDFYESRSPNAPA
jgi:dTDP-4-amino-4,6-dideoxygalactose transaminase